MSDDPFEFLYDRAIRDENNDLIVSVTVVDADLDSIQVCIESGTLRIPFFLTTIAATELAGLLINAVAAHDRATEAETTTE